MDGGDDLMKDFPMTLGDEVEVELDIFSGRPNPRWSLSGRRVTELEERLAGLEPVPAAEPQGLGYRGLVIRSKSGTQIRAFNSVVTVTHAHGKSSFGDRAGLEKHLLDQADEHGFGDLVSEFRDAGSSTS
jgi:hypothetical protein